MKRCKKCLVDKKLEEFSKNKNLPDGYQTWCKLCFNERAKTYITDEVREKRNKKQREEKKSTKYYTTEKRRKASLKHKFNLSLDDYENKLRGQNYICANEYCYSDIKLCVDHNRSCCEGNKSCGKCVRGLLCHKCNVALGMINDSIEKLQGLIIYLNGYR